MKAVMIFAAILVACSAKVKAQDLPSLSISDLTANPVSISNLHLTINSGGAADNRVDLNTATVEQIDAVAGIGEAKAQAIVDSRDMYPFFSFEEVTKVDGISATLAVRMCDTFKLVPPVEEH
jgi:competence ComEA-like helix-hairpin-helix protein